MKEIFVTSKSSLTNGRMEFHSDGFKLEAIHVRKKESLIFSEGAVYLFIQEGELSFEKNTSRFSLGSGFYFSKNAPFTLELQPETFLIAITTPKTHRVLDTIGGPVEDKGRLNYIDGCSDSLLLAPVIQGEPCLNLLHFPVETKQTMHNHPSFRFGIVTSGSGMSVSESSELKLNHNDVFFIPAFVNHKFDTFNQTMNVIAFHPDSDWGPTDEVHPMINRTWVNGKKI